MTIALVLVGLTGLTQIVLGVLFWTGHSLTLIPLHMRLGYAFMILLWAQAAFAAGAGAAPASPGSRSCGGSRSQSSACCELGGSRASSTG